MLENMDQDLKAVKAVIVAGGATSLGNFMDWFPSIVGVVASLLAIALSIFMLCIHNKRNKREIKEHKIRMILLRKEIKEKENGNKIKYRFNDRLK